MADSSIQKFQRTVKPFLDHKNAYKEYKGETTEGGVPQTEEREKIMAGREFQKKLTDIRQLDSAEQGRCGAKKSGAARV